MAILYEYKVVYSKIASYSYQKFLLSINFINNPVSSNLNILYLNNFKSLLFQSTYLLVNLNI